MRKQILASAVIIGIAANMTATAEETTTVGGNLFIDFTNINLKNDDAKQAISGTGTDVKRGNLIVNHTFDDMWAANVTTDFNYTGATGETQVFIKKAYLQATVSDAFIARAGSAGLPWVPLVEDLYGYRYVEKVLIDRTNFGTSADWGLHALGKFGDGMFNYAAAVVNGRGFRNPTRSNSVDFEARIGVMPIEGLTAAVGIYRGKRGLDSALLSAPATRTANRTDVVVGYVKPDMFRVGAEFFSAKNWNTVLVSTTNPASTPEDKSDGYSAWGSFNFTPEFAAFARYDEVKPSKDLASWLKDKYFNIGVSYKPRKNVDIALAYKNEKVEGDGVLGHVSSFTTGDATLGSATGGREGKWDEVGVWLNVLF
jgi:hypothetical protein